MRCTFSCGSVTRQRRAVLVTRWIDDTLEVESSPLTSMTRRNSLSEIIHSNFTSALNTVYDKEFIDNIGPLQRSDPKRWGTE